MTHLLSPCFRVFAGTLSVTSLVLATASPAHAEKADRTKPLNVVADRDGNFDLLKQVIVFSGNVTITKGSIIIKADRVEVRERPDGYKAATAFGSTTHPATFRQKREGVDEFIDGQAERLEYDEKPDTIRFVGNAVVRRTRGASSGDEITGNLVTYDNTTEVFSVTGGAQSSAGAASATDGRVRAVLTPREGTPAAAEAASAAAAAALKPSSTLGDKK